MGLKMILAGDVLVSCRDTPLSGPSLPGDQVLHSALLTDDPLALLGVV